MKVGAAMATAGAQATQRLAGAATTSFAELLASGTSVSAIRSERALGFSETGLLGATRSTDAKTSDGLRPTTSVAGETQTPLATRAENTNANKLNNSNGTITIGGPEMEFPIPARGRPLLKTERTFESLADGGHSRRIGSRSNDAKKLQSQSPIACLTRRFRADKSKRWLSLSGPDDALTISIHEFSGDEDQETALFFALFSIAGQFGMTLRNIRLNKVDFGRNFESGRESWK